MSPTTHRSRSTRGHRHARQDAHEGQAQSSVRCTRRARTGLNATQRAASIIGAPRPARRRRTALEQVSGPTLTRVHEPGVLPVRLADSAGKAVGRRRHQDQVHVVRHQAVALARQHRGSALPGGRDTAHNPLPRKHWRAAIAPLRHMMREAGDDQASKARHQQARPKGRVRFGRTDPQTCTRETRGLDCRGSATNLSQSQLRETGIARTPPLVTSSRVAECPEPRQSRLLGRFWL